MSRPLLKFALLACVMCFIAACGQKGDLVKPDVVPAKSSVASLAR